MYARTFARSLARSCVCAFARTQGFVELSAFAMSPGPSYVPAHTHSHTHTHTHTHSHTHTQTSHASTRSLARTHAPGTHARTRARVGARTHAAHTCTSRMRVHAGMPSYTLLAQTHSASASPLQVCAMCRAVPCRAVHARACVCAWCTQTRAWCVLGVCARASACVRVLRARAMYVCC